jgi:hypothetical protein
VKLKRRGPSVDQIIRVGIDTSKNVFQLHGVNVAEQPVLRKKMRRKEMIDFFTKCRPTVIGIMVRPLRAASGYEEVQARHSLPVLVNGLSWISMPTRK